MRRGGKSAHVVADLGRDDACTKLTAGVKLKRNSLRRNTLAQAMPQTPLAGGATDTAQAASGLISTA